MPQDKRRKTTYYLNKGVNQKTSKYTVSDAQVNDLFNLDFDIPNALSKRPGSTLMVTANTSGPVNSLFEFEKLGGASYMLAGTDTAMFTMSGGSYSPIATGYGNGQAFDILAFTDKAFFTNGETFRVWDGATTLQYSVNVPYVSSILSTAAGSNAITVFGITNNITFNVQAWAYTYTRIDGFEGPLSDISVLTSVSKNFFPSSRSALDSVGGIGPTNIPANVSAINIYCAINVSDIGIGGAQEQIYTFGASLLVENLVIDPEFFRFVTSIPAGTSYYANFASTDFNFNDLINTTRSAPNYRFSLDQTYVPRFIEITQNRLFASGFSAAPSTVFFSEIGEPERVQPEYFFEVRTNDSDYITGQKSYRDELIVFKRKSFHKLVGDSADNYTLVEISTEYGCLSNKAIAEYNNKLLFLDEKGIVEFNGGNFDLISDVIEPVFQRMNVNAIQTAVAVHDGYRNQVWFGIPVDGSTTNNLTVVYDYLLNAWTFFDGFNPASLHMAKRELTIDRIWQGDYSGNIFHFSPSFYSDNGTGITCLIETKFDAPDGQNVENAFRRFFLDVEPAIGVTGDIDVDVYRNYSRSARATFTIYQDQYQTRKDFGVNGKSVAFQISHNSASLPLTIYGYTVQRRYLRDV